MKVKCNYSQHSFKISFKSSFRYYIVGIRYLKID